MTERENHILKCLQFFKDKVCDEMPTQPATEKINIPSRLCNVQDAVLSLNCISFLFLIKLIYTIFKNVIQVAEIDKREKVRETENMRDREPIH